METESQAYHALVADGGRPSHPIELLQQVMEAPGGYRDILSFWQDRPDEWQVFTKQLHRWKGFRIYQLQRRETLNLVDHANEVETFLASLPGFDFARVSKTPTGRLKLDSRSQGRLPTWFEYLLYEYSRRQIFKQCMKSQRPQCRAAWLALSKSGVLRRSERRGNGPLELRSPSSTEVARRMYRRRKLVDLVGGRDRSPPNEAQLGRSSPEVRRQLEEAWLGYTQAKKELERMELRAKHVAEFRKKTRTYRDAKGEMERHEALLQWAVGQLPLIAQEEFGQEWSRILSSAEVHDVHEVKGTSDVPKTNRTFPFFPRIPPELRHQIWTDCLPPHPTAHFFDVLNHPRKRHMAQHWSTREFRVSATTGHNSGYRTIYHLLAVCRESRIVVARFYRHLQQHPDPLAWRYPFPVFQDFNWIPAGDLIVLCFPPKQAPLPEKSAITFSSGPARPVGIYFPKEVLLITQFGVEDEGTDGMLRYRDNTERVVDDESQIPLVPEFLDTLRGGAGRGADQPVSGGRDGQATGTETGTGTGGIRKLYLLYEGWQRSTWDGYVVKSESTRSMRDVEVFRDRLVQWEFSAARYAESVLPWYKRCHPRRQPGDPMRRDWWWLGSGVNALTTRDDYDSVERTPGSLVESCKYRLEQGCSARGWAEFEGAEVLGWVP